MVVLTLIETAPVDLAPRILPGGARVHATWTALDHVAVAVVGPVTSDDRHRLVDVLTDLVLRGALHLHVDLTGSGPLPAGAANALLQVERHLRRVGGGVTTSGADASAPDVVVLATA